MDHNRPRSFRPPSAFQRHDSVVGRRCSQPCGGLPPTSQALRRRELLRETPSIDDHPRSSRKEVERDSATEQLPVSNREAIRDSKPQPEETPQECRAAVSLHRLAPLSSFALETLLGVTGLLDENCPTRLRVPKQPTIAFHSSVPGKVNEGITEVEVALKPKPTLLRARLQLGEILEDLTIQMVARSG